MHLFKQEEVNARLRDQHEEEKIMGGNEREAAKEVLNRTNSLGSMLEKMRSPWYSRFCPKELDAHRDKDKGCARNLLGR